MARTSITLSAGRYRTDRSSPGVLGRFPNAGRNRRREPELRVRKEKSGKLILSLLPDLSDRQEVLIWKESPTRVKVIEVKPNTEASPTLSAKATA